MFPKLIAEFPDEGICETGTEYTWDGDLLWEKQEQEKKGDAEVEVASWSFFFVSPEAKEVFFFDFSFESDDVQNCYYCDDGDGYEYF